MSNEPTAGAEPNQAGSTGTAPGEVPDGYVPQGKVNSIEKQWRKQLEAIQKERDEYVSKLEQIEQSQKTDREKELASEYKRGAKETEQKYQAQINELRMSQAIDLAIASRNIPAVFTPSIRVLLGDVTDPAEIPGKIEEVLEQHKEFSGSAQPAPTIQAGTSGVGFKRGSMTAAELAEAVRSGAMGDPERWKAIKDQIRHGNIR